MSFHVPLICQAFPHYSQQCSRASPIPLYLREFAYKTPPAVSTTKHIRAGGGRNAKVRGQIVLGTRAQTNFAEGPVRNDSSSSSDEDHIYGVNRISRQCGRTTRTARVVPGSSQNVEVIWEPAIIKIVEQSISANA